MKPSLAPVSKLTPPPPPTRLYTVTHFPLPLDLSESQHWYYNLSKERILKVTRICVGTKLGHDLSSTHCHSLQVPSSRSPHTLNASPVNSSVCSTMLSRVFTYVSPSLSLPCLPPSPPLPLPIPLPTSVSTSPTELRSLHQQGRAPYPLPCFLLLSDHRLDTSIHETLWPEAHASPSPGQFQLRVSSHSPGNHRCLLHPLLPFISYLTAGDFNNGVETLKSSEHPGWYSAHLLCAKCCVSALLNYLV